ncbi:hypothetical protein QBC37DRAFT_368768 [Rhypophila decipiens]|uniref:Clr5 domain-containing protein n=1 Tax=Rhypophila decipiens TaxID=261697 RepID=A0AAN7BC51_9PEZI|nr:hypothetical protein QBC37DRAFT_368768 [Rhypophila decipiens]
MAESSPSELKWMNGVQVNAKRIPDDVWEGFKAIILKQYETHTLDEVKRYMAEHHNFVATKRQFIHRVMEKWKITKYNRKTDDDHKTIDTHVRPSKKPGKSESKGKQPQKGHSIAQSSFAIQQEQSYVLYDDEQYIDPLLCDMSSQDVKYWYSLLADLLYALGDSQSAFQIRARLYQYYPDVLLAVACGRSAQAKFQIEAVRDIIEKAINKPDVRDDSWIKFLFGAQLARTWDQVGDKDNAFEQTAALVDKYLDLNTSQPRQMATRGPELDIAAYIYLRHLILQYNKDDLNFEEGDPELKVDKFLENFLEHQPYRVFRRHISCLSSCLNWCIDMLEANSVLPGAMQNIPEDSLYKIVCLLWRTWTQGLQQSQRSPQWTAQAMEQLGISASELLTLVVCTIMATIPAARAKGQQYDSTVADAIRRANKLRDSGDTTLLDRFLVQVQRSADQRMAARDEVVYLVRSAKFQPVRNFIATCVPEIIKLPVAHSGFIYPLLVTDPVHEEPVRKTPSPPGPSFVDFQHGQSY